MQANPSTTLRTAEESIEGDAGIPTEIPIELSQCKPRASGAAMVVKRRKALRVDSLSLLIAISIRTALEEEGQSLD